MKGGEEEELPVDEETEAATDARTGRHDRSDRASHSTQSPLTCPLPAPPPPPSSSCTASPAIPPPSACSCHRPLSSLKIPVLIHVLIDSRCSGESDSCSSRLVATRLSLLSLSFPCSSPVFASCSTKSVYFQEIDRREKRLLDDDDV